MEAEKWGSLGFIFMFD